mmetsp:Transcript_8785/g.14914  ORF Transcript_8785/g.14914 Transcript_8785/m.14914 type:complete len:94 (+) Transcript_8785:244-525(+)
MNLSMGTFGSFDNMINQAEQMIAEFEHQLDLAILHLENKTKMDSIMGGSQGKRRNSVDNTHNSQGITQFSNLNDAVRLLDIGSHLQGPEQQVT